MKLTVEKSIFLKELGEVGKYRNRDKEAPFYAVTADDNGITFTAGNNKTHYVNTLPLQIVGEEDLETVHEVHKAGTAILSSKFDEVLRKAPGKTVDIEVQDNVVTISTTGFKASVPVVAKDMPVAPNGEQILLIDSPYALFDAILKQTGFAHATSESRPALTGIHLKGDGTILTATCTDSHRLAQLKINSTVTFEDVIIPAKQFMDVLSSFDPNEKVKLYKLASSHVKLVQDDKTIYIQLLDGTYPDVSKLIDIPESKLFTVKSKELLAAIDRALLFGKTSNGRDAIIRFEQSEDGLLRIFSANEEGAIDSEIAFVSQTAPLTQVYGINGQYLKEAVRAYQTEEVTFHVIDNAQRPIFIKNADKSLVLLVLPVKIAS